jgi:unsaturated rhamnogalacturonyl hydrolase
MLHYAQAACDTLMKRFAPGELPPVRHFHYHQGVFLSGMQKTALLCGDEKYDAYIKGWFDSQIDDYGNITSFNPGQLDDLQPGILLFPLYKRTGDRYHRLLPGFLPAQSRGRLLAQGLVQKPDVAGRLVHGGAVHGAVRGGVRQTGIL